MFWFFTFLNPIKLLLNLIIHWLQVFFHVLFENFTFSSRSHFNSKKEIKWFIMISAAIFQPPNSSINASKCIPRFLCFCDFVFYIFEKYWNLLTTVWKIQIIAIIILFEWLVCCLTTMFPERNSVSIIRIRLREVINF